MSNVIIVSESLINLTWFVLYVYRKLKTRVRTKTMRLKKNWASICHPRCFFQWAYIVAPVEIGQWKCALTPWKIHKWSALIHCRLKLWSSSFALFSTFRYVLQMRTLRPFRINGTTLLFGHWMCYQAWHLTFAVCHAQKCQSAAQLTTLLLPYVLFGSLNVSNSAKLASLLPLGLLNY